MKTMAYPYLGDFLKALTGFDLAALHDFTCRTNAVHQRLSDCLPQGRSSTL